MSSTKPELSLFQETTLKKLGLDNLDKIINITYLKKTPFKSFTKKDFCLFINHNVECLEFMKGLEKQILNSHTEIQTMLTQYLEALPTEISEFRHKLKELKRQQKLKEDKLKEDEIFQRKLQEMIQQGKKTELETKLGVKLPDPPTQFPMEMDISESESTSTSTGINLKFTKKNQFDANNIVRQITESQNNPFTSPVLVSKHPPSLDLATFYQFFQQVIKRDLILIKDMNGQVLKVHDIDLDLDPERIRLKLRTATE